MVGEETRHSYYTELGINGVAYWTTSSPIPIREDRALDWFEKEIREITDFINKNGIIRLYRQEPDLVYTVLVHAELLRTLIVTITLKDVTTGKKIASPGTPPLLPQN